MEFGILGIMCARKLLCAFAPKQLSNSMLPLISGYPEFLSKALFLQKLHMRIHSTHKDEVMIFIRGTSQRMRLGSNIIPTSG